VVVVNVDDDEDNHNKDLVEEDDDNKDPMVDNHKVMGQDKEDIENKKLNTVLVVGMRILQLEVVGMVLVVVDDKARLRVAVDKAPLREVVVVVDMVLRLVVVVDRQENDLNMKAVVAEDKKVPHMKQLGTEPLNHKKVVMSNRVDKVEVKAIMVHSQMRHLA